MNNQQLSRRTAIAALLCATPIAAAAQGSLFDRARGLFGSQSGGVTGTNLSQGEIGLGLKDALKIASERVVGRVGSLDGYNGDPTIQIPLPDALQTIAGPLRTIGASGILDDLQLKMNRAAEQAAPQALDIFVDAATQMSFDDARTILTGPQDSATQYFKRTTSDNLTSSFSPIVDNSLSGVGAVQALGAVQQRASTIPFVGQSAANFSLTEFTVGKALDGLFYYLGVEEALIRSNPAARTTDLVRRVFG
jgi:hypothetical protein